MNAVSLINPFSSQHHAIRDFKNLRGSQKAVSLLVAAFTLTFTFGLTTVPAFRSVVRRYTVLNAKKLDKQTSIENVRKQLETLQANAKVKEAEAEAHKKTITKLTSDVSAQKKTAESVRTSWKATIDERDEAEKKLKAAEKKCSDLEKARNYQRDVAARFSVERNTALRERDAALDAQRVSDNTLREEQQGRRAAREEATTKNAELQRVRNDLAARLNELNQANNTVNQMGVQLITARADLAARLNELNHANRTLNQRTNECDVIRAEGDRVRLELARLGPTPRVYTHQAGDERLIPGAFERSVNFDPVYTEKYSSARTMTQLLTSALEDTIADINPNADEFSYEQLTDEANPLQADQIRDFHCLHAYENADSQPILYALYGCSILQLIRHAKLSPFENQGCGEAPLMLTFNQRGDRDKKLQVYYSETTIANVSTPEGIRSQPLFEKPCSWAPEPILEDAALTNYNTGQGIDPISLKWILERLEPGEHDHLRYLILAPLMLDNNEKLVAAKAYMNQNNDRGELLRKAFQLLNTLSCYVGSKYAPKHLEPGSGFLDTVFNRQDLPTFTKPIVVENIEGAGGPQAIVVPAPKYEFMMDDLAEAVRGFLERESVLAQNMGPGIYVSQAEDFRVLPEGHIIQNVSELRCFNHKHEMTYLNGCFFGAVSSALFGSAVGDTNDKLIADSFLKFAMANFLDNEENADKFKDDIEAEDNSALPGHKFTLETYKNWLRGATTRDNYQLGTLEANILSELLGIRIEMFATGQQVLGAGNDGLNHPNALSCHGPKTRVKLFLYNCGTVRTWYSLHPKVRAPAEGDTPELARALEETREFWLTADRYFPVNN